MRSSIIPKKKICVSCGKPCFWFSQKMCKDCATVNSYHKRLAKITEEEEGMPELIARLDALVSRWVRYSAVGSDGLVECYTSRKRIRPEDADCGHYVGRSCMFLRWDLRNVRPQSREENRAKYGSAAAFGKRLDEENPGITEILWEESRLVVKFTRDELKQLALDFEQKLKSINKLK